MQTLSLAAPQKSFGDIVELAMSEIDDVFGGGSLGEAMLIGGATGAFVGSFASPAGMAIGGLIGLAVGAVLYELP